MIWRILTGAERQLPVAQGPKRPFVLIFPGSQLSTQITPFTYYRLNGSFRKEPPFVKREAAWREISELEALILKVTGGDVPVSDETALGIDRAPRRDLVGLVQRVDRTIANLILESADDNEALEC